MEDGIWNLSENPIVGDSQVISLHLVENQSLSCSLSGRFQEIVRQFLKL